MRTDTNRSTWIKRALATGLLSLAPVVGAISLSAPSVADTGAASPITAANAGHSVSKAPAQPSKPVQNAGVKHHHHHRHQANHDSDES